MKFPNPKRTLGETEPLFPSVRWLQEYLERTAVVATLGNYNLGAELGYARREVVDYDSRFFPYQFFHFFFAFVGISLQYSETRPSTRSHIPSHTSPFITIICIRPVPLSSLSKKGHCLYISYHTRDIHPLTTAQIIYSYARKRRMSSANLHEKRIGHLQSSVSINDFGQRIRKYQHPTRA